jgi:hypothetical protein
MIFASASESAEMVDLLTTPFYWTPNCLQELTNLHRLIEIEFVGGKMVQNALAEEEGAR